VIELSGLFFCFELSWPCSRLPPIPFMSGVKTGLEVVPVMETGMVEEAADVVARPAELFRALRRPVAMPAVDPAAVLSLMRRR